MTVTAIYRSAATGEREPIQPDANGHYVLVDTRIPYSAAGCRKNLRNRASMAVRAFSLDEAALLIEDLGYAARVKVSNGDVNYLAGKDLIIERR